MLASPNDPSTSYDPFSSASKEDPEQFFSQLRTSCPVHHFRLPPAEATRLSANPLVPRPTEEFWSVLRHEACLRVLLDSVTFSSKEGPGPERMLPLSEEGVLLFADDPAHRRQRRIAAKAFTPRAVQRLEPRIEQIADDLLRSVADTGTMDLLADFAVPLTIRTIAGIVGVDESRVAAFWRWGNAIVAAFGGSADAADAGLVALTEMFAYVQTLIDQIRSGAALPPSLDDGVLAALVRAEDDGARLTDEEIRLACMQLVTAGYETTSTGTASAVYLLSTHPSERAKLIADPSLMRTAVEEVLRYLSPLEGLFRTTTTATTIDGCPVPAGAKVRVVYASANRDADVFPDAGSFRIDRSEAQLRPHLAFGQGAHFCIGAALARAELRIALTTLLERLPDLELDDDQKPQRNGALVINGFTSLRARWSPDAVRFTGIQEDLVGP